MSIKYHAGRDRKPLCGARGTGAGYYVVILSPQEWNATAREYRCKRCIAKIQAKRQGADGDA